ncbi:MAG TPA: SPOR domain-containing protein [Vicinamibacterales bacterium]|nr:SPOR domain-containing protein [Vicinamibacterales bacterium]
MAATQEESFREIQLSGKALVFVFMAGVVILVTVFLMGLLVGRGVLATRGPAGAGAAAAAENEPAPPPASATSPSSASPATAGEKLSYAERLGSAEPAKEQLKAQPAPAASVTPPTPKAESSTSAGVSPSRPEVATAESRRSSPAADRAEAETGFAIQVAALREKDEADVIVKRLAGKGYPAYVVTPAKGAPSVFRVRVGKYKDRREADTVSARLQKEEQFKPWIVR